jgi:ElaB/YqjD/DUF883 family membrane-anchored ribosome-binding protein
MEVAKSVDPIKSETTKSISHTLVSFKEAAKESSEEIGQMVNKDLKRVKEAFADLKPKVKGVFREIRDASMESIIHLKDRAVDATKEATRKVDGSAHKKPWMFVGAAALLAGVLGSVLGKIWSK